MVAEFVTPNLHVALIHYPLGLLVAGVLVEAFAFLGWRRSSVRVAARWMIGVGAVGGVVAAFSGIYALRAVARPADADTWAVVRATSPVLSDPHVWTLLRNHTLFQSVAAAAAMAVVVVWLGCSDRGRRVAHVPVLIVLLASVGGMLAGAWFGGETIYRHGVGVGVGVEVAAAVRPPGQPVLAADKVTSDAAEPEYPTPTKVEQLFPPVELHVLMAGVVTALALVSIGLSARQVSAAHELADDRRPLRPGPRLPGADLGSELAADPNVPRPPTAVAMARSFNPTVEIRLRPRVPAARFWLLAAAVAVVTAAGGWFVLARSINLDLNPRHKAIRQVPALLWAQVRPRKGESLKENRLLAHTAGAAAIVVLPVVLAVLARFAPRQRILLGLCTVAILIAASAQVWLGVLLLYDGSDGAVNHFKPPGGTVATAAR